MCLCQAYGKSGVANERGYCLVCGELVERCRAFRPDHNGECLNCDEWMDAHTPEAIALGEQLAARSYTCPRCGAVSYNPHDLAQRYCGRCHQFEEL